MGGGGARSRLGTSQSRGLMLTSSFIFLEGIMLYTNSLQITLTAAYTGLITGGAVSLGANKQNK